MYERMRTLRIQSVKTYYQILIDAYYIYICCIFMTHYLFSGIHNMSEYETEMIAYKEEHHNLSGLINEIMCSA